MNFTFEIPSQRYQYFSTLPGVSDDILLTFKVVNPNHYFDIFGVHNQTMEKSTRSGLFSFQFNDISKYWHVHHEKELDPSNNPDIIAVYNPLQYPIQVMAFHQYLTF